MGHIRGKEVFPAEVVVFSLKWGRHGMKVDREEKKNVKKKTHLILLCPAGCICLQESCGNIEFICISYKK